MFAPFQALANMFKPKAQLKVKHLRGRPLLPVLAASQSHTWNSNRGRRNRYGSYAVSGDADPDLDSGYEAESDSAPGPTRGGSGSGSGIWDIPVMSTSSRGMFAQPQPQQNYPAHLYPFGWSGDMSDLGPVIELA